MLFGECLHNYLIKDAIFDNNVLGFHIEYIKTMEGDFDWDDPTLADAIDIGELYMSDERMSLIANHIIQNHKAKTRNGQYTAIFAVSSIDALASGNPKIMEKMQLDADVAKLKLQKASHLSQRYALEDSLVRKYPAEIAHTKSQIRDLVADMEMAKSNTIPGENGFSPMVIMGETYNEKTDAGNAIFDICGRITNQEPKKLGRYRGFDMEIVFDKLARGFVIHFCGKLTHMVIVGQSAGGLITRMDNVINGFSTDKKVLEDELCELYKQVENAKAEIAKPFADEAMNSIKWSERCR